MVHAGIRKCGHIAEYFILGALLFRAFCSGAEEKKIRGRAGLSLVVIVLYAACDEFHQSFTMTREASLADVGIDALGGTLALITGSAWKLFRKNKP
jgi:VanZ family protein